MTEPSPDVLRFLKGIDKKHGRNVELVLKYRNSKGKVRRRQGHFLGLRGDSEVGLRNEAWSGDRWFEIEGVVDAWKKGSEGSDGG
jgi:hypothetical protein